MAKNNEIQQRQKYNALAIVHDTNTLKSLLEKSKQSIAEILPKHLTPERMLKMALVAANRQPKILNCTQSSVLRAIMTAAECGLDYSGTTGQGYLIPYKNTCQFIPGYRGLMDMARRSGKVTRLEARVVYANDKFIFSYGVNQRLEHQPKLSGDRGEIVAVYGIAQLSDGSIQTEVMTIDEINAIRKRSKAADDGPWVTDFSEMARKTVLRRLCKYIPSSPELERVLSADAQAESVLSAPFVVATDPDDGRSETEKLAERLAAANPPAIEGEAEEVVPSPESEVAQDAEPEPEVMETQAPPEEFF